MGRSSYTIKKFCAFFWRRVGFGRYGEGQLEDVGITDNISAMRLDPIPNRWQRKGRGKGKDSHQGARVQKQSKSDSNRSWQKKAFSMGRTIWTGK